MESIALLHIFVVSLAIIFAQIGVNENKRKHVDFNWNFGYLVSFLILLLFLGFRESLGKDLVSYEKIYTANIQQDFIVGESRELGFLLLINFLRFLNLDFQAFIFSTSLLMLFLLYVSFRKFYYLLPLGIFIFFMDWGYAVTINTIRQGIALMAFLNASLYVDSKEKRAGLKFLFFIFCGALFHYSILFFLPFYYIGRLKLSTTQFLIFCISIFIFSFFLIRPIAQDALMFIEKYEAHLNNPDRFDEEHTFRLGATLVLFIRCAPVLIYNYTKKVSFLQKYYVLYFTGLSVYYGFFGSLLVTRFTFYLQFFELFVIPFFLYYLFVIRKQFFYRMCGVIYTSLMIFLFFYKFNDFLIDQLNTQRFSLMFIDFYFKG